MFHIKINEPKIFYAQKNLTCNWKNLVILFYGWSVNVTRINRLFQGLDFIYFLVFPRTAFLKSDHLYLSRVNEAIFWHAISH
jgi:hypothetical protein